MSEPIINRFLGIKRIALIIAYDNNIVIRDYPEERWLSDLDQVLGAEGIHEADLQILDKFSTELSEEDAETLAAGEITEMEAVESRCPRGSDPEVRLTDLFNDIFEFCPEGSPEYGPPIEPWAREN